MSSNDKRGNALLAISNDADPDSNDRDRERDPNARGTCGASQSGATMRGAVSSWSMADWIAAINTCAWVTPTNRSKTSPFLNTIRVGMAETP